MFWRVTDSCLALGYLPLLMQPRGWPLSLSLRNSLESEGLSCSPLLLEVLWRANSQSECYWHRISWSRGKGEKRSISLLFQSYWMSPGWSFFAWEYEYLALIFNRTHTRCNIACNIARNVTGVEASSTSATFHATIARSIARNVASCVRSFSLKQYVGRISFLKSKEIQCCCLSACIWWQQKPKAQNVGTSRGPFEPKDGAEKKLFLGTEFQELSCYSLVNEKGTSNLRYADLHVINRTVVGPEMTPAAVHEIDYFRRSSGLSIGRQLSSSSWSNSQASLCLIVRLMSGCRAVFFSGFCHVVFGFFQAFLIMFLSGSCHALVWVKILAWFWSLFRLIC